MKVLVVCSVNSGKINPFITEQVEALRKLSVEMDFFLINRKGIGGYLGHFPKLMRMLGRQSYDIVHAHYGLAGLLAVIQRRKPVVTTFHGSDVNQQKVVRFSRLAARFSAYNIVVEKSFTQKLGVPRKTAVIPCGIDFNVFYPIEKNVARNHLGLKEDERIVLFTSRFDNPVKNYPLAKQAMDQLPGVRLIELKGMSREQVNWWMNASDLLLLTSFSEGSPQVVKEALACNLPVVSTPVGDVPDLAQQVNSIHIVPYDAQTITARIKELLANKSRGESRELAMRFDNNQIAQSIRTIYSDLASK
jgi:teichuronic acid biosynthesis glycosyltransferase TuaC